MLLINAMLLHIPVVQLTIQWTKQWCIAKKVGISPYMLETRRRGVGVLGDGCPPPSRLEGLGECLPAPLHHILGIFQGLRSFLVETMHYRVYGIVKCEKLLAVPNANEVSIRCPKNTRGCYMAYTHVYPQYTPGTKSQH